MTTNKDALDRLYRGSFGVYIRDGDEIQEDYELLCQALQTQADLVEALREICHGVNPMDEGRAAQYQRGKKALARAEEGK